MAARRKRKPINLLPREGFEDTTLGHVLAWLLSTFRIIVIVTEMIVMIAFLSRFWLDAKSSDLNDLIRQKQAVIAASSDFEKEFRHTQKKLEIFSALTKDELSASYLETVTSHIPPNVYLSSFAMTKDEIRLKAVSPSERSISQFIVNLESSERIEEVAIVRIDTSEENQYLLNFALNITVKKEGDNK